MGEAKRRQDNLRATLLKEMEQWARPSSDEERALVDELMRIVPRIARRESAEKLAAGGMPPQECHANANWYAANDPSGDAKHVTGWWRQGDRFVLHSVIEVQGELVCITPQLRSVDDIFAFIPDAKIEWRNEEECARPYRNGVVVPVGLRADPEGEIEIAGRMRDRLLSGMNPNEAMHLFAEEQMRRLA